jgi:hypothetical protein
MLSLIFGLVGLLFWSPFAEASSKEGPRLIETFNAPSLPEFLKAFSSLEQGEQSEIVRLLASDLKGWKAFNRIPSLSTQPQVTNEQREVAQKLITWVAESPQGEEVSHDYNLWKFIELVESPLKIKIKFDKGLCVRPSKFNGAADAVSYSWWGGVVAWWKEWREPTQRIAQDFVHTQCQPGVRMSLVADPGNGESLKEDVFFESNSETFADILAGKYPSRYSQRIRETIEIWLADRLGEGRELPSRLRVLDLAADWNKTMFEERRDATILMRARTLKNASTGTSPGTVNRVPSQSR